MKTDTHRSKGEKVDRMKELYNKVKSNDEYLEHEHVIDLVDTLIGRKKIRITFKMILKDMLQNFIPCKKRFRSEASQRRKRIFSQAHQMLDTQFDIKHLFRNSFLI